MGEAAETAHVSFYRCCRHFLTLPICYTLAEINETPPLPLFNVVPPTADRSVAIPRRVFRTANIELGERGCLIHLGEG